MCPRPSPAETDSATTTEPPPPQLLHAQLHALAEQLTSGHLTRADAARRLRGIAAFQPAPRSANVLSMSRELARLDVGSGTWAVQTGGPGRMAGDGPRARVISNAHTEATGNYRTELDLDWVNPAELDAFGRALCDAAATVATFYEFLDEQDQW